MEIDSDGLSWDENVGIEDKTQRESKSKRKNSGPTKDLEDSEDMMAEAQTASKKKKKKNRETQNIRKEGNASTVETLRSEYKVMLTFDKGSGKHMNPICLTKAISKAVGVVHVAQCLGQGRVLIIVKDVTQRNKLIGLKEINDERVTAREVGVTNMIRGVIFGIPLDITMEEITGNMKGGKITNAKRLIKNKEGKRYESLSILLTFEGKIPERVQLGFISYSVREFVPKPLRCFKCQRIGHVAAVCRGRMRCPKCGDEHEYDKCPDNAVRKCCNCGGPHSAAFGGCEVQLEAREVQKYKTENKVTYAEAVKVIRRNNQGSNKISPYHDEDSEVRRTNHDKDKEGGRKEKDEGNKGSHSCLSRDESLVMSKENFLVFIIKIINVTAMISSRSAKMKVIIDAASEFLGITGITVQMIHEILSHSSAHEASQMSN